MVLGASMISCDNTPIEVKNPKQETTVELQQMASVDTITYKVVERDNKVYIISTKDNTVVKKISNDSGFAATVILFMAIIMIALILIGLYNY